MDGLRYALPKFLIAGLAWSSGALADGPSSNCGRQVEASKKERLIAAFDTAIVELRGAHGFLIKMPNARDQRVVRLGLNRQRRDDWRSEAWEYAGKSYIFVEAGLKEFEDESRALNAAVADHLLRHPEKNLLIEFTEDRVDYQYRLNEMRWHLGGEVLQEYLRRGLIRARDIPQLEYVNRISSNSDVFALYEAHHELTSHTAPLLESIQVSYFGNREFFRPSLKGVLERAGYSTDETFDLMPFAFRIPASLRYMHHERIFQDIDRRTTSELTRYSKFLRVIPKPIADRVLAKVYRRQLERNVETILASGNDVSVRRFRRYGFTPIAELPSMEDGPDHVLAQLKVRSRAFDTVLKMLEKNSREVNVSAEP